MITDHTVIGIDAGGQLCSCGTHAPDLLEHLGEVAINLWPATATRTRQRSPQRLQLVQPATPPLFASDAIDRLIRLGHNDDTIRTRLGVPRSLVRDRRRAWKRFESGAAA